MMKTEASLASKGRLSNLRTISELAELHSKGVLTRNEFEKLARVMATGFIEEKAVSKIDPLLQRIFNELISVLWNKEPEHKCPYCGSNYKHER